MKGIASTNLVLAAVGIAVLGVLVLLLVRGGPPEDVRRPETPPGTSAPPAAGPPPTPAPAPERAAPADPEMRTLVETSERMRRARTRANELAAVATLRSVVVAQAHFMATGLCDRDRDGRGEAGTFAELSGAAPVRGTESRMDPPALSEDFRPAKGEGGPSRLGYRFRLFLPEDADRAESAWFCVATPDLPGVSGTRVFLVTQSGEVRATTAPEEPRDPAAAATFDEAAGGYVPDPGHGEWAPVD